MHDYSYAPVARDPEYRTAPRTSARTTAWNGKVTDNDENEATRPRTRPPGLPLPDIELRRWTDQSGTFSVIAKFGGKIGENVTLHKIDGTTITIRLGQLCQADQNWILARR
jgi:hypothetical protein